MQFIGFPIGYAIYIVSPFNFVITENIVTHGKDCSLVRSNVSFCHNVLERRLQNMSKLAVIFSSTFYEKKTHLYAQHGYTFGFLFVFALLDRFTQRKPKLIS